MMQKDPTALMQIHTFQIRDDGVVQIAYAEPNQQSAQVTRLQTICFEIDLVPDHLFTVTEDIESMIYEVILRQKDEESREKLRPS